jgi:hypothetical protein
MATLNETHAIKISGGSFLIGDRTPDEVFTPEDFTEAALADCADCGRIREQRNRPQC